MKKTVGVLSLLVMLLSQVFSPFAYAVTGDTTPIEEPIVEEVVEEPEAITGEPTVEPVEPENTVGGGDIVENKEGNENNSGGILELPKIQPEISSGDAEVRRREENNKIDEKKLEGENEGVENLSGAESSSGFYETIKEGIKNLLGMGSEENNETKDENKEPEEEFDSKEIYGTGEYEGVKVEVYAQTGLFASGTELTIIPVIEEKLDQVKEVLLSGDVEILEEEEAQTVIAFDITFRDSETQEERQPKNGTVQVTFNYEGNEELKQAEENEEQEVKVYHLNDIDEKGEKIEEITGTKVEDVQVNEEESVEENKIVVEAEIFSIYAIIKSNLSDPITIKYNANGGKFKSGNTEVSELSVTYTKENGVYKPSINIQAPYKESQNPYAQSGWMFAGWYTTEGEASTQTTEWLGQVSDTTTNNKTVYAKWLPFNDLKITMSGVTFTIMDRNLGAEDFSVGYSYNNTQSTDKRKIGRYYQWGNNYGFPNDGQINVTDDSLDLTQYGYGNYLSNPSFMNSVTFSTNKNMWGGEYSMSGDYYRQGPCPTGYHVPLREERVRAYSLYNSWKETDGAGFCSSLTNGDDYYCFPAKLQLPYAGYRNRNYELNKGIGTHGAYWASTYYRKFTMNSDSNHIYPEAQEYNQTVYSYPIRCFKDSIETDTKKLLFVNDGGITKKYDIRRWEAITNDYKPEDPIKEGYKFMGWYEGDKLFNFSNPRYITEDLELTAKRKEGPKYIYDTNGGVFNNGDSQKIVVTNYNSEKILKTKKYSHTQNIGDDGKEKGDYDNDLRFHDIITLTGAEKLRIKIKYETEFNADYLMMWTGAHPNYSGNQESTSIIGKLNGRNYSDRSRKEIEKEVEGDTVTFYFYSDHSLVYKGYYAEIQGIGGYDANKLEEEPIRDGYRFFGRYKSGTDKGYDFSQDIFGDIILYANRWNEGDGGESEGKAIFTEGPKFNAIIKSLASDVIVPYTDSDNKIEKIKRSTTLKGGTEVKLVSSSESEEPIYVWYDNNEKAVKYYTPAKTIYFNKDSSYMFNNLIKLNEIDLEGIDTSEVTNMSHMFEGCSSLTELNLNFFDTRNVKDLGWMFSGCGLKKLNLDNWDLSSLPIPENPSYPHLMSQMLACPSLEKLSLKNWEIPEYFGGILGNRWSGLESPVLQEIDVTNRDLSRTKKIDGLFAGSRARSIKGLETWDTSNITNMSEMFNSCPNLTYLDLSNFDTHSVTAMSNMFAGSSNLTGLVLDGWDLRNGGSSSIIGSMFGGTTNLQKVSARRWKIPTTFTNAIGRIASLSANLDELDVTDWDLSQTNDILGLFGNSKAKKIVGLETWNTSNIVNMSDMFGSCENLTGLNLSAFDTRNVTSMGGMFYKSTNLISIDVGNFDTSNVTDMSSMFYDCTNLTGVDLSSFDTSKVTNMSNMFYNANKLKTIYVGSRFRTNSVTSHLNMFYNNTSIVGGRGTTYQSSYINKTYARIDGLGTPGYFTKKGEGTVATLLPGEQFNAKIKTMAKGSGVTSSQPDIYIERIKRGTRDQLIDLWMKGETYEILSTNDSEIIVNGWYEEETKTVYYYSLADEIDMNPNAQAMFKSLTKLESVEFSGIVTSSVNNMASMFDGCTSLTYLDLSNFDTHSVISMGSMFGGCSNLTGLVLDGWDLRKGGSSNIIGSMFGGANNLQKVSARRWKIPTTFTNAMGGRTSSLTSENLQEIDVTDWNLSQTTDISGLFASSRARKIVGLETWNTSNITNMNQMFSYCQNLTTIDISHLNTKNVSNMGEMFSYCTSLTYLDLSNFNTHSVTTMSNMFAGSSNLTGLVLDGWDLRKGGSSNIIGSMFGGANNLQKVSARRWKIPTTFNDAMKNTSSLSTETLQEIDVTDWDLSQTTSLGSLFGGSYTRRIVGLDTWDTSNITTMGSMFGGCSNLTGLVLDGWDLRKSGSSDIIGSMFGGANNLQKVSARRWKIPTTFTNAMGNRTSSLSSENLQEIDVTDWDLSQTTNIYGLFAGSNAEKIIGLETWDMSGLENIGQLFYGSKIKYVDLSNKDIHSVKSMQDIFQGCSQLTRVNFHRTNLSSLESTAGMFGGVSSLKRVDFSYANMENVKSTNNMFLGSGLTGANFSHVILSGVQSTNSMFGGISSLKRVDFSYANMENVTSVNSMFGGNGLTGIDFSHVNLGSLESTAGMFGGNSDLKEVNFESTKMNNVNNMASMFGGCSKLEKVNFSGVDMSGVKVMASIFGGDSKLIEWNLKNAKIGKVEVLTSLFGGCSSLTGFDFSNWDLSNVTNMTQLFAAATSLESVNFGENKIGNVENMYRMFYNCSNLEEIDMSTFNTNSVTNMDEMFKNTSNLKTIYVGDSFSTSSVTNHTDMFLGATSIEGGKGTTYDENHIGKEYARVDGGEDNPGYFTDVLDKKYTITYNLGGGTIEGARMSYTQRTNDYTLPQPIRAGYIFKGWTGSNGTTAEKIVSIAGKKGNLTFTANWEQEKKDGGNNGGGGGGSSSTNTDKKIIENKTKEQEHNTAEEETNQETKTQEKGENIKDQTNTQQSTSHTATNIGVDPEILSAYEWAYKYSVTTLSTLEDANPEGKVKRGHLAKMIVNYATNVLGREIPEKIPNECKWNDRRTDRESEEIKDYAVKSCALGLMGLDMDKFLPNMEVTRAQFGTIMSRLLWGKKYAGGTPYYRKHLNALKENNIMTQIENPEKRVELRQWVWLMLMRSAENK